jgi:hypothetical protein
MWATPSLQPRRTALSRLGGCAGSAPPVQPIPSGLAAAKRRPWFRPAATGAVAGGRCAHGPGDCNSSRDAAYGEVGEGPSERLCALRSDVSVEDGRHSGKDGCSRPEVWYGPSRGPPPTSPPRPCPHRARLSSPLEETGCNGCARVELRPALRQKRRRSQRVGWGSPWEIHTFPSPLRSRGRLRRRRVTVSRLSRRPAAQEALHGTRGTRPRITSLGAKAGGPRRPPGSAAAPTRGFLLVLEERELFP